MVNMKSKKEIKYNKQFIKGLSRDGVVGCKHWVKIMPPAKDEPKNEKAWTVLICQRGYSNNKLFTIVVAWYKTHAAAKLYAKNLRKILKQL